MVAFNRSSSCFVLVTSDPVRDSSIFVFPAGMVNDTFGFLAPALKYAVAVSNVFARLPLSIADAFIYDAISTTSSSLTVMPSVLNIASMPSCVAIVNFWPSARSTLLKIAISLESSPDAVNRPVASPSSSNRIRAKSS